MSGASLLGDDRRGAARRAAIEIAKATLIARDGVTSDHSDDVGVLCAAIARQFDLDECAWDDLMAAAQLHDVGKVALSDSILQKPGPLDENSGYPDGLSGDAIPLARRIILCADAFHAIRSPRPLPRRPPGRRRL